MKNKVVAIATGCSGGHIIPALTLARQKNPSHITAFTRNKPLDISLCTHQDIQTVIGLSFTGIPHKITHIPLALMTLCTSIVRSTVALVRQRPGVLITTGSYAAIPTCIAAYLMRIPIELYEVNIELGKATRFIKPLAHKSFACFSETAQLMGKSTLLIPYPVRFTTQIQSLPDYDTYGFDRTATTLFILGGSQGSLFLNSLVEQLIEAGTLNSVQMIHQTGVQDARDWQATYQRHGIKAHVFSFTNAIAPLYQLSDGIITRAGAGTLAEIAHFNKAALIVPLETPNTSHQRRNAEAYVELYPQLFSWIKQNDTDLMQEAKEFIRRLNRLPADPADAPHPLSDQ